jgi:hypothetical protein
MNLWWPEEYRGGEQEPPGLELLWQQEIRMSGPHPSTSEGSSWWAGVGKVRGSQIPGELLICKSHWGRIAEVNDRNKQHKEQVRSPLWNSLGMLGQGLKSIQG